MLVILPDEIPVVAKRFLGIGPFQYQKNVLVLDQNSCLFLRDAGVLIRANRDGCWSFPGSCVMLKAGLMSARERSCRTWERKRRVVEFDRQLNHGSPEAGAEIVTSNFVPWRRHQEKKKASMLTALG